MSTVFLGLGSNLGNRQRYLKEALRRISQLKRTQLKTISDWIETAPIGGPPQGKYLNEVAQIETELPPLKLLQSLKAIERQMGRPQKRVRWGPRVIDLDLLSYGDLVLKRKALTLPHPGMHERPFVLGPLSEIAPDWQHPIFKLTAKELLLGRGAARMPRAVGHPAIPYVLFEMRGRTVRARHRDAPLPIATMRIVRSIQELRRAIRQAKGSGRRIGFVPTMGAFHEGHLSLIRKAAQENDFVVVSIFVNPIQFNRPSDFKTYPRTLKSDALLSARAGAHLLFVPREETLYPPDFQTFLEVTKVSRLWEGKSRPGHFKGVATIVAKLFNLVQPDSAYFGQKDAQQARVVGQMIQDLHFPIRLRVLPTVREPNGLALSSRNCRLSLNARRSSRVIFQALQEARRLIQLGERRGGVVVRRMKEILNRAPQGQLDYAVIVDPDDFKPVDAFHRPVQALIALWIGKVRLIDGCLIRPTARRRRR